MMERRKPWGIVPDWQNLPPTLYMPPHPPYFPRQRTGRNRPATRKDREEFAMRAETQTLADEIKQSLALLRRHL